MQTEEWDRRALHAQLASWAQLRHDTLLYAKPSYTVVGSCHYPDGWVDPYPDFYEALAAFGDRALARLEPLGLLDLPSGAKIQRYFQALRGHPRQLASIARSELAGMPLDDEQMQFIKRAWRLGESPWGDVATGVSVPIDGWSCLRTREPRRSSA